MSNVSSSSSSGIGFLGLLTICFIVLKLCKVIEWTWFWVLSPFWIPAAVFIFALAVYGILLYTSKSKKKSKLKQFRKIL